MIAEYGLFSLVLAFLFSLMGAALPLLGLRQGNRAYLDSGKIFMLAQAGFVALSLAILSVCFLRDDFSVRYVLSNSGIHLPWFYKLCAVWGGHEGSMLLWVGILSAWSVLAQFTDRRLPEDFRVRAGIILSLLSAGFILFLLMTSNPFARDFSVTDSVGRDLNPLLQDPGFLFHPPMLYMGYVGFAVPFAFAIAALWEGRAEPMWFRITRPWILASWSFLTAGITLGSWWAYRELGWGGWWFWDPVENASFMPWLVGTALVHSGMVSEKRGTFRAFTLLLAIVAFSLSLVGTFLVRSGVLTSVHAFATDPARGLYILVFLLVVAGGAFLLYGLRAHTLQQTPTQSPVSRETAMMLNNVFMSAAMLTVLLGTLYPLLIDGLGLGKLSVGAPYFNAVFVPLMVPVMLCMGLGMHLRWQKDSLSRVLVVLRPAILLALLLPALLLWVFAPRITLAAWAGLSLGLWVFLTTIQAFVERVRSSGTWRVGGGFAGMMLAHIGVGVCAIGISVSDAYGIERDVRMAVKDSEMLAGYRITFMTESPLQGPNYRGTRMTFLIECNNRRAEIHPEKRLYNAGKIPMTDAAIDVNPFRDIYIAPGEPLDDRAWSVRLYYKPLIRGIWAGGFLILAGGLLALTDRRLWRRDGGA